MYMLMDYLNNVCLNLKNFLVVEYTYFYRCVRRSIEATVYTDCLKGGEEWISLTGFSSTLKSQKPTETVSKIEKLKFSLATKQPQETYNECL